jgi:hypothetical protein
MGLDRWPRRSQLSGAVQLTLLLLLALARLENDGQMFAGRPMGTYGGTPEKARSTAPQLV